MPEQHECDWEIGLAFWEDEPKKPIPWAQCRQKDCKKIMNANEIESRLNSTGRFLNALRDKLLISPGNETICTWCGSSWAIGSPHEWHDEDCPLYADIL